MAVNKSFVVKNGLEVNTDLIVADSTNKKVGVGSTAPRFELDVAGGIGATDVYVTGVSTVITEFNVGSDGTTFTGIGGSVGIGTAIPEYLLDVRSAVSTGQTAVYVQGDMRVTGDLNIDDIVLDDATIQNLTVTQAVDVTSSGISTFGGHVDLESSIVVTGISTFSGYVDLNNSLDVSGSINAGSISTIGGYLDVNNSLDVSGSLNVAGITTTTDKEIYTQFDITNNGVGAYQFAATGIGFTEATDNPTLYLNRGKTYKFSVNASGHPFYIKTSTANGGTNDAYNNGVVNNGAAVGVVSFKVPFSAPKVLYYQCSNHSAMKGTIYIVQSTDVGSGVGVASEGTFIGAGATTIDFKSTTGTNIQTVDVGSGIATVTIVPGASIGLVIALGG